MDVEYGSQGCLMEQRQRDCLIWWYFVVLTLNSSASRCSIGPFNVCLVLLEDCNTKNLKQAKMPLHILTEICPSQRVGHFKAPCQRSGWMKTRINNQTEIADNENLLITL